MKVIWIDTETTGLNTKEHGIYQIAYIIDIDGEVKEKGEILFNPGEVLFSEEALKVNGKTVEEIKSFQSAKAAKQIFESIMSKYVDKYNKNDKFIPAGFNVKFDLDMIRAWWDSQNDKYYGSWFDYHFIDIMALSMIHFYLGKLKLPNYKLKSLCDHFKIKLDAHDAMNDIIATRELLTHLIL